MIDAGAFAAGLRWMAAGRLSAQVAAWATTIVVMRLLSPEDYGLAAVCAAATGLIAIISEFALSAGLVQARQLDRAQLRSVFGAALMIATACALVLVLLAPLLAAFFRAPAATPLIQVSATHLLLAPLAAIPDASIRRDLRFRAMAALDFSNMLASSACTLMLALSGAAVWALVLGPIGGSLARVLMLQWLAPARLWPSFRLAPARDLLKFGTAVASSRIAGYVFGQSDLWVAGRMLSKVQLGEYSVAMQLAMLPLSKTMSILNEVIFPLIAKMNRQGEEVRTPLLVGLRSALFIAVPILWGLVVAAPHLLPLLIGSHWDGAIPILQLVCLVLPVRMVNIMMSSVLQGRGRADIDLRNTLTGALMLPPAFLAGVQFGAIGLAWAWVAMLPLTVLLNLARSREVLMFTPLDAARTAMRPTGLGFALLCAGFGVQAALPAETPHWASLLAGVGTSQFVYWGLLAALDGAALRQLVALVGLGGKR